MQMIHEVVRKWLGQVRDLTFWNIMVEATQTAVGEQPDAPDKQQSIGSVPACPGRLSELYDVQKAVGKGGYAVVYKGIRRGDGRVVAVKRVEVSNPYEARCSPVNEYVLACVQRSGHNSTWVIYLFVSRKHV